MGRRRKVSGDGPPAGATAAAASPAKAALPERRRVSRASASLEGWPPTYYCYACHNLRRSAESIRADYCEECNAFLDELLLAYKRARLSAAYKTVPEA